MTIAALHEIEGRIQYIRGFKVIIDSDLAGLYGTSTKALNQAIKRNTHRFPPDFMFQLTAAEKRELVTNCDRFNRLKHSTSLPLAFTEHGAIQAANVLASPQAADMSVYVVRAFVHLREMVASHKELALRLDEMEANLALVSLKHDGFERDVRTQLKQLFAALRELMNPPEPPPKRPIGFIRPDE